MKKKLLLILGISGLVYLQAQNSAPTRQWIKSNNGFSGTNESVVKSVKDNNGFYYVLSNDNNDAIITKFDNSGAAINIFRYNEPSNNTNFGYDIKVDASGNMYVCGVAFVTNNWNWQPTIAKLSPTGNVVWEQVIACQYYTNSSANAIAFDNSNNIYFTGANSDSLSIGLISSSGTLIWEKKYHPTGYTVGEAADIVTDAANNAYITGKIMNSTNGNYDYTAFKVNSSGSFLWTKFLNGAANSDDEGMNIEIDGSANTFVTGIITDTSTTNTSVFLIKYNASGGQQWSKKYYQAGQVSAACGDLTLDAAGNNYIATNHYTGTNNGYVVLTKNSSSGSQSYSTVYNDASYVLTEAHSIKVDVLGNLFLGGKKRSNTGDEDMFASKFSTSGVFNWTVNYDSYFADDCKTIHLDNGNNAVLNGTGSGTGADADPAFVKYNSSGIFQLEGFANSQGNPNDENIKVFCQNNYSIYSLGRVYNDNSYDDVLLSKYDPQGNILWQNVLDYSNGSNVARDMAHDANYNISVLADQSYSTSLAARFDSIGSPIYTTYLNAGVTYKKMVQDASGNDFLAGDAPSNAKDFSLAKVTPAGTITFQTTPATNSLYSTNTAGVDIDGNGRLYVFGEVTYDPYGTNPVRRFQLQKFGPAGAIIWTRQITGIDSMGTGIPYWTAKKIIVSSANQAYVLMTAMDNGGPNYYALVVKFDSNGNEMWRRSMNGNNTRTEFAVDMVSSGNNSISVLTTLQWQDLELYNLDKSTGTINWDTPINYPGYSLTGTCLAKDNFGNLYAGARGFGYSYDADFAVIKTDSAGAIEWMTAEPGDLPGNDIPYSMDVANSRIYIAGAAVMNNGTNADAALIKLCDIDPNTLTTSGTTQNICPGNIVTLSAGNAGAYQWNVSGQTDTTITVGVSGMYWCTTYKSDGCWKNTDTISVTIKNPPVAPSICQVTVDTSSTHNIILWDKMSITDADSVRIYREDVTNVYSYVGSVSMDSLSEYHDYAANPNVTTKRYRISAIDSCGNESSQSLYHNTIYIIYNGLGQFSWNPLYTIENSANPVNNYILMRDDVSNGNWQQVASTAGTQSTIVDTGYANYPNGRWRVETVWNISCDPTRALVNTSRSNIKAQLAGPTTGIEESTGALISFSPNPFNQYTQIDIRTKSGKVNFVFELYDETGRLVRTAVVNQPKFILDKGELAAGIYFYRLADKESSVSSKGKLVVQD